MYVFEIPFLIQKSLSEVLDAGDGWEDLASLLNVTAEDVFVCRQAPSRSQSSTLELLRIWGSRGHTVDQLYRLLAKIHHRRAMAVIHDLVDPKYHRLLNELPNQRQKKSEYSASVSIPSLSELPSAVSSQCRVSAVSSSCQHHQKCNHQPTTGNGSNYDSTGQTSGLLASLENTLSVHYNELKTATDNFNPNYVVGKGGYGVVYKGEWKHTIVAVKRILFRPKTVNSSEQVSQQEKERLRQSLMELKALALYRHDHILPLYGYSLDGPEPCLVYQFMAGGSLEDRLQCRNNQAPLTWSERVTIVKGGACGLNFLHSIGSQPLIHGDVKSANILLDSHFQAKLGDFGLSRSGQVEVSNEAPPLIASHIKGTLAYLPPEFIRSKHLSSKLDVYSFGVVLLEVASGLRAYSENRKPENLVTYIQSKENETKLNDVILSDLIADVNAGIGGATIVNILTETALLCCDKNPSKRPPINEVLIKFTEF